MAFTLWNGMTFESVPNAGPPPEPAAPSNLVVAILEETLSFGDTATAVVSVDGFPTPTLAFQWTLDGGDVPGQTGATFDGVPVGALRVRVVPTNSEGAGDPVTSDPVTVTPRVPAAPTINQWALDATGESGEAEITLLGLPAANGAAITSVERQVDDGAWVALPGIDLDTPYTLIGLTNGVASTVELRAVNSAGAGPEGDTKSVIPFGDAVPEPLGDNEFTFQPVPGATELELAILRDEPTATQILLEIDSATQPEVVLTALDAGPVNLDPPTHTGTPAQGQTLTAAGGRWLHKSEKIGASTWRWLRNGSAIGSATSATYEIVEADVGTLVAPEETVTDAQGSTVGVGEAVYIAPVALSLAPVQGKWFSRELYSDIPGTFVLNSGDLPAGMSFMEDVGIVHGTPTVAGAHSITVTATTPAGATEIDVAIDVAHTYEGVQGGSVRRLTTLGVTSPTPAEATYAVKFKLPSGHASDVSLMRAGAVANAYHLRVIGSTGRIRFELWDTAGTSLGSLQTTPSGTSYFDDTEHELVINIDLAGPTITAWIDGVSLSWSAAPGAGNGSIATEATSYSFGTATDGSSNPIPSGGFIRWGYVEWGALRTGTATTGDFANGPENAGTPHFLFGGLLSDWTSGRNYGSTGDWATVDGTWAVADASGLDATPQAFDGALGFGRYATGGVGEDVFRVTNTSASAATSGSLPWALAQALAAGGGYILIEAEGALELTDKLYASTDNLTIDARRQPGMGFWINGGALWVEGSNVVLRHLRCYPGSNFIGQNPAGRDALIITSDEVDRPQSDVYVERCDAMFSIDEALSVFPYKSGSPSSNITFHGCLVAEPCHENLHVDESSGVDNHAKGPIIGASASNVTFYGCLFASADDRMPRALGQALEFISCVTANYGSTGIQVSSTATADFINTFFMKGDRPGNPTTTSSKWVQGTTSTSLEVVYESGCFTGAWTLAGGFDDAAMIDSWRNNTSSSTYMDAGALDNDALFTKSGAAVGALSYSAAFLSLGERVGALNVAGERHPYAERVVGYITEAVPFSTGWHGTAYTNNMPPDELRAQGATVTSPGAGLMTVTLPAAPALIAGREWTGVTVTVVRAYDSAVELSDTSLDLNGADWDDGVTLPGSLTGGAVPFNGLPDGFYTARVTYAATGGGLFRLYMGRPVEVT